MRRRSFESLLGQLSELSRQQLSALLQAARGIECRERVVKTIETARAPVLACPRCQATGLYRHGHANSLQRFRCKSCGRTFNSLTGTPLARLRHKAKWLDYCNTLLDPGSTVRRAAECIDVHRNTSFRWRHRMLTLPKLDRHLPLTGIVEADEIYVLESHKGSRTLTRPPRKRGGVASRRGISREQICVLVARDRTGRTVDAVTGKGAVSAAQLRRHLAPALAQDVLLVTDSHAAYRSFARSAGIRHQCVNLHTGERVRGAIHVQNVNAYHSRLRAWLHHFRGVATRYLANYCGWRWAIDGGRIRSPEMLLSRAVRVFHSQR